MALNLSAGTEQVIGDCLPCQHHFVSAWAAGMSAARLSPRTDSGS